MTKTYYLSRKALKKPKGAKAKVNIIGDTPGVRNVELLATILKKLA